MADDFADWKLEPAQPGAAPNEVGGWTLEPAPPQPKHEGPTTGKALLRGAAQGATLGFADESAGTGGLLGAMYQKYAPEALGGMPAAHAKNVHPLEAYGEARDAYRKDDATAKTAHPGAYMAAELAGSLPTAFIPGLGIAKGAGKLATIGKTMLAGGIGGLGGSEADSVGGDILNAGVGAGMGGALGAGSRLLKGLGGRAAGKVASIDEAVARKAAEDAASATMSARSEAGRTAQDAYKQLEHLRELGAMGRLTPEEAQVASELQQELAGKAQEKLLPAAARKAKAAEAFADAARSEANRAGELAAQKLSGKELKQQVGARALRYGLPAVLGAAGAQLMGHSPAEGALFGGALGHTFRPMMHSLLRLGRQPVVQRPVFNLLDGAATRAATPAALSAGGASLAMSPAIAAQIAALRGKSTAADYSDWAIQGVP